MMTVLVRKKAFHYRSSVVLSTGNSIMAVEFLSVWLFSVFGTTDNLWQNQSDMKCHISECCGRQLA